MQYRKYELPHDAKLKFFNDPAHFAQHARDHFLSPREPWHRLLGAQRVRRIAAVDLKQDHLALQELYDHVVPIVDEGVQFSIRLPVYVIFSSNVETYTGREFSISGFYFIAEAGFKVIANGGVIRSVYFCNKTENDSKHTLFHQAWRTTKIRMLKEKTLDTKHKRYDSPQSVEFVNEENWRNCPNPHESARRMRTPPTGWQEWDDWLNETEEIARQSDAKKIS